MMRWLRKREGRERERERREIQAGLEETDRLLRQATLTNERLIRELGEIQSKLRRMAGRPWPDLDPDTLETPDGFPV